jgi:hypothetical protein
LTQYQGSKGHTATSDEAIAGETVIELTQEENNMRERYDSEKKCICKKESERCDTLDY